MVWRFIQEKPSRQTHPKDKRVLEEPDELLVWHWAKGHEHPPKALMELKQATGASPTEIKTAAANGDAFFGCECSNDDGLALIIKLHDSLQSQGVETIVYEDGKPSNIELFRNLLISWHETSAEMGLDDFEF